MGSSNRRVSPGQPHTAPPFPNLHGVGTKLLFAFAPHTLKALAWLEPWGGGGLAGRPGMVHPTALQEYGVWLLGWQGLEAHNQILLRAVRSWVLSALDSSESSVLCSSQNQALSAFPESSSSLFLPRPVGLGMRQRALRRESASQAAPLAGRRSGQC